MPAKIVRSGSEEERKIDGATDGGDQGHREAAGAGGDTPAVALAPAVLARPAMPPPAVIAARPDSWTAPCPDRRSVRSPAPESFSSTRRPSAVAQRCRLRGTLGARSVLAHPGNANRSRRLAAALPPSAERRC